MAILRRLSNLSENLDDDFLARLVRRDSLLLTFRRGGLFQLFSGVLSLVLIFLLLIPAIICIAIWSIFQWQIAIDILIGYTAFILLVLPICIIIWQLRIYFRKRKMIHQYLAEHPERAEDDQKERRL